MQQYAFSNIDHFATSSLITRMTTDVTVLQNAVNGGLRPLVRSPVLLLMGVGLSFSMNPAPLARLLRLRAAFWRWRWASSCARSRPCTAVLQRAVDALNNVVQEGLTAIRAVKAFVRGEYEEEKFERVNAKLMQTTQKTFHYATFNLPAFQACMYACVVLHHVVRRQHGAGRRTAGGRADGLSSATCCR